MQSRKEQIVQSRLNHLCEYRLCGEFEDVIGESAVGWIPYHRKNASVYYEGGESVGLVVAERMGTIDSKVYVLSDESLLELCEFVMQTFGGEEYLLPFANQLSQDLKGQFVRDLR